MPYSVSLKACHEITRVADIVAVEPEGDVQAPPGVMRCVSLMRRRFIVRTQAPTPPRDGSQVRDHPDGTTQASLMLEEELPGGLRMAKVREGRPGKSPLIGPLETG